LCEDIALMELSRQALVCATRRLKQSALKSQWSDKGIGWQERWLERQYAGLYASCDGVIFLSPASGKMTPAARRFLNRVFAHHVCRVMDSSVEADTPAKARVRSNDCSITMKVAKFIQAYAAMDRPREHNSLAVQWIDRLEAAGRILGGKWTHYLEGNGAEASIVATVEAAIALSRVDRAPDLVERAADYLAELARPAASRAQDASEEAIIPIWALSEVAGQSLKKHGYLIADAMKNLADAPFILEHKHWHVTFERADGSDRDWYHLNVTLLFLNATLNLVKAGIVPASSYWGLIGPVIQDAADTIRQEGLFRRQGEDEFRFWEHCEALNALGAYVELAEQSILPKGGVFMQVNPRRFRKKQFTTRTDLIVILMPFTKDWSGDVFKVFENAGSTKGFKVWRSDMEFTDDEVMQTIWEQINEAKLVVADCTGKNPNVFYELGLADTIGKPVFVCAQDRKDIPFDITPRRSHTYKPLTSSLEILRDKLIKFIEANP
jgi:hypothetical protein